MLDMLKKAIISLIIETVKYQVDRYWNYSLDETGVYFQQDRAHPHFILSDQQFLVWYKAKRT